MTEVLHSPVAGEPIENVLRAELAHGDAMIGTIIPIMRHLLASDDHSVFSEEIVARTRSMLEDVARQLLIARGEAGNVPDPREIGAEDIAALVHSLCTDPLLLAHVHALALEFQLSERLHGRLALDPVLSPMLQALIASTDAQIATSAMNLLAAQTRFVQSQRRMQLSLLELPADVLHAALIALRQHCGPSDEPAMIAEKKFCETYDEARTRLGLMTRLILGMGGGAQAALSVEHAGVALFLTALSIAAGQDRALATLATNEGQVARLALALSASGMKASTVEQQFVTLHPDISLPTGFEDLGPDRAAAILSHGAGYPA
ncbi:hypothetical protein [Novosphingobium sp. TH158]|uniref:hypothetical protein n=1 Tax=Novosphingobium sp. TH158 TaxID=2067455 RepID=UPI000C7A2C5B|nr:hypothetical protein [Novosphingobium sp. TH158]PLK27742.1 hypothetical protein C0V78_02090 [Novosphingobium sp. TH158]